ncbi:hypothetical protein MUK42_37719 [Musa troglodytarum]|uniref:Uncharacterized protein n=1 Tax=Musa troglodytarum TaxID=320322 RepID=A0A9E7JZS0_9LILI|nr:hypothetical protein MUK42_37719 [Musa troglodytarum]
MLYRIIVKGVLDLSERQIGGRRQRPIRSKDCGRRRPVATGSCWRQEGFARVLVADSRELINLE